MGELIGGIIAGVIGGLAIIGVLWSVFEYAWKSIRQRKNKRPKIHE